MPHPSPKVTRREPMRRLNLHLTSVQFQALDQLAIKTQAPVANHVRSAIDAYLKVLADRDYNCSLDTPMPWEEQT